MLLLCALVGGVNSAWADDKTIEITYSNFTNTSYNTSENTFLQSVFTFGYINAMRNGSNGTPNGWAKDQVIQTKSGGYIYNKTAIHGLKSIRVYIVTNTNSFTVTSGDSAQPTTNSVTRPNAATGTESITYSSYSNKTVTPGRTTTASYYDFTVDNDYFRIAPGGSLYIWKIVLTYTTPTHTLTYSATNGSITGVDAGSDAVASGDEVAEGATVTLTATPSSGYEFSSWSVSGDGSTLSSTTDNPTTFTMGTDDATVTANFVATATSDYINVSPTITNVVTAGNVESFTITTDQTLDADPTQFYTTADGDVTTTKPAWITEALYDESTLLVSVAANTGAARTAYFRVEKGTVKSSVITINQEAAPLPSISAKNVNLTYDATSGSIVYTVSNTVDGGVLTAAITAGNDGSWLTLGEVTASPVPLSCSANEGGTDRTATVTLTYTNSYQTVTKDVTITQAHLVVDYATLPFSWEGGSSSNLTNLTGVTASGLGSDYASGNTPYLVKLDGTGDYIQIKTNEQPGVVTIGVKMIGGATTSTITVQGSADGETFTKVEDLTISGSQNDIMNLTTTNTFATTDRYIRLYFTKGSNVGLGPISISKAPPATPTFSVAEGEYDVAQNVTISCTTEGTTIHYTTDGSMPTSSSTAYSSAIPITTTTTLKAIAIKDGVESDVASATYTMIRPAAPTFDVEEGIFNAAFTLHLSAADGATIYYTTDGSTPTSSNTAYIDGISIPAGDITVNAIAVKNGLTSDVATATYTYDTRPAPTFTLSDTEMTILVLSDDETITLTTNSDGAVTFTSSNGTNLEVDNSDDSKIGVLSAFVTGDYTITVQTAATSNYLAGEGTVTVHVVKKTTTMTIVTEFSGGKDLKDASTGLIEGTVKYNDVALSPQPTITYSSSDETVATVDEYGNITFKKAGTTKLTASYAGDDEYAECNNTYVLSLVDTTPQATEVTISFNNTFFNISSITTWKTGDPTTATGTNKNVTVTYAKATGSYYYCNASQIRCYSGNTLSFTAPNGYNFTSITFTSSDWHTATPSTGSMNENNSKIWEGSNNTVSFSWSSTARIESAVVILAPTVTIGESGYLSYCSPHKLDFSETVVKAYKASVNNTTATVRLTQVNVVPAGEGVVLFSSEAKAAAEAKTYSIPVTVEEASDVIGNEMVGVLERTQVRWNPSVGVYNYILQQGQFNKATESGGYLKANRAYLSTDFNVSAGNNPQARMAIVFNDETTGISTMQNAESLMDNVVYDLQGRRVETPRKGSLYIVNGKKVVF